MNLLTIFKFFFQYCYGKKQLLLLILLLLLVGLDIAASTYLPFANKILLKRLQALPTSQEIFISLLAIMSFICIYSITWFITRVTNYLENIVFFPIVNETIKNLNLNLIKHVHSISWQQYNKYGAAELISYSKRISHSIRTFLSNVCIMLLPNMGKILLTLIAASLQFGLFSLLLYIFLIIAFIRLFSDLSKYTKLRHRAWEITDRVTQAMHDSILNTKFIRFYQKHELNTLTNLLSEEASLWLRVNTKAQNMHLIFHLIIVLMLVLCYTISAYQILNHKLDFYDFILLQGQIAIIIMPLKTLTVELRQINEAYTDVIKLIKFFTEKHETIECSPEITSNNILTINNLAYSYYLQPLLLHNINLTVQKRDKIAITGASGSGKSTIVHLIIGLLKPTHGSILLYNKNVNNYTKDELGSILHFIPQDVYLFNNTLKYNLCYANNNLTEDTLYAALEKVKLQYLPAQLANGLDTQVGELGTRLSGGEKQRLALARAYLMQPKLLILDEIFNAMDPDLAQYLMRFVIEEFETVIIIAHSNNILAFATKAWEVVNNSVIAKKLI